MEFLLCWSLLSFWALNLGANINLSAILYWLTLTCIHTHGTLLQSQVSLSNTLSAVCLLLCCVLCLLWWSMSKSWFCFYILFSMVKCIVCLFNLIYSFFRQLKTPPICPCFEFLPRLSSFLSYYSHRSLYFIKLFYSKLSTYHLRKRR